MKGELLQRGAVVRRGDGYFRTKIGEGGGQQNSSQTSHLGEGGGREKERRKKLRKCMEGNDQQWVSITKKSMVTKSNPKGPT